MPVEPTFDAVSPTGAQPPYVLAKEALAHAIAAGILAPQQRLPSERHLCEQLGISRTTLRAPSTRAVTERPRLRLSCSSCAGSASWTACRCA